MPNTPELDPEHAQQRETARAADPASDPTPGTPRITRAEQTRIRDARAAELRVAGYDYRQIARALGYRDHSGAYKAVRRAQELAIREAGSELVALELSRYDTLQRAAMTKAVQGDPKSINAALRVMDARAKLLGLHEQRGEDRIADARQAFAVFLGAVQAKHPDPDPQSDDVDDEPGAA